MDGTQAPSRTSKACLHVLLFSLLVLLLLPSMVLKTGGISKLKSGWDIAILFFGLFAILCRLLGRGGGGDHGDADRYSVAGVYDAELLYQRRRDERPDHTQDTYHLALRRTTSDVKAIPVEVRTPQDTRIAEAEERIHPMPETLAPARSRTWSPEELNATLSEVEKEIIMDEINNPLPSSTALFQPGTPPPPPPPPVTMCEASASLKATTLTNPLPPASSFFSNLFMKGGCCFLGWCVGGGGLGSDRKPPKRSRPVPTAPPPAPVRTRLLHVHPQQPPGVQGYPQKPPLYPRCGVVYCSHPLQPPPPPSPLPVTMCEASASLEATTLTNPLPPASSFFSNLFMKGGCCFLGRCIGGGGLGGDRKPPKPPSRPVPTALPPALVRTQLLHTHPQQPPGAQGYPQKLPLYPRCGVVHCSHPLSPPPPPPPLMSEGKDEAPSVTASPASSSCVTPDVNTKADKFIEHFRARLKLEKINSYRENLRIQEGATEIVAEEGGEFMVIGSLFEDDNDMSLPAPPPRLPSPSASC